MRHARTAARGAGLLLFIGLAGCLNPVTSPTLPFGPRPPARFDPAPDLRIPPGAVAAVPPEIPLVPLPVPPLDRPGNNKTGRAEPTPPPSESRNDKSGTPPTGTEPSASGTSKTRTTVTPEAATTTGSPIRRLYSEAAAKYAGIDSYIVRLTRRENVRGKDKAEEVILFKFRKNPWSLHFTWLDGEGQGREVVFVKGCYENKLQTLLAAGDIPLTPGGKRLALPIDSMMVRSASRHPITEAGFGASIERLGKLLDACDKGDRRHGALVDLGPQPRPEFSTPVHGIAHMIPAGCEADFPHGGKRTYWFDPDTRLPLLVVTYDERGKEVEYYHYTRLMTPVNLDDQDFDPDRLWGAPGSQRPARTARP